MKTYNILILLQLVFFTSCSQQTASIENKPKKEEKEVACKTKKTEPHRYGGWYCPDNLKGFPPVNIANWKNVPVVNGRMATKDETQNGTSLIFVDMEKYPNAKPLNMTMPKLARFFNHSSQRNEIIIVIQALNIDNDSIVGFRYLNGGNGSARLSEVNLLNDNEINILPKSNFVTHKVTIQATPDSIWNVLTNSKYSEILEKTFDTDGKLKKDWRKTTNMNFKYAPADMNTAKYADLLYGNFYIQNDYEKYSEKFFVSTNQYTKLSQLEIVCGPFTNNYEAQKNIITNWAQKVVELSQRK